MAINEIVCIGDSLAMHDTENGIFTHDTYPYQIAELIPKFVMTVRNRRANTSIQQERNQNIYDDIHAYFPSVFIIHIGIVDCSPRVFGRYLEEVMLIPTLKLAVKSNSEKNIDDDVLDIPTFLRRQSD